MPSLKEFAAVIAKAAMVSPSAVYERQRALTRSGLLPPPERGRGKGLMATSETVSIVLIALLATDSLSETDERVKKLASARFLDPKLAACPWTGQKTFRAALKFLLADDEPWDDMNSFKINVSRTEPQADIEFNYRPKTKTDLGNISRFGAVFSGRFLHRHVTCLLRSEALWDIREGLRSEI